MNAEDKRVITKQYLESRYTRVNKLKQERESRRVTLQARMEEMRLDESKARAIAPPPRPRACAATWSSHPTHPARPSRPLPPRPSRCPSVRSRDACPVLALR